MRIFLSAQQALRHHAVPGYAFWEYYFKQGLAEAGHEVLETPHVDWAEGLTRLSPSERHHWLDQTWSRTMDYVRSEHARKPIDLFLGYLFPDQVEPSAVAALRSLGIPSVNFFCDNVREFTHIPDNYYCFDLHWVPEAGALSLYSAAKLPHLHAPMPMWVPPELRTVAVTENAPTVFIGSHDALREDLLGDAVSRGLQLRLHGAGWKSGGEPTTASSRTLGQTLTNQFEFIRSHGLRGVAMRATYQFHPARPLRWIEDCWHPLLEREDYFRVTRESRVVIGINRYPSFRYPFSKPGRYSRLRDIEAPMLGACYLTEFAPGISELYEDGVEIETYRTVDELVGKTAQLQSDPARRAALRKAGQRRALTDHSIARSVGRIATQLGLTA